MSESTTTSTVACTVERRSERGDWYAFLPVSAFDQDGENDASGPFSIVRDETVQVRFGGRGGAIIAAAPDEARAVLVVASVRAMREHWGKDYRKNDARPGAIPSTIVSIAQGAAKTVRQGAAVRKALGGVPAYRRVTAAPKILEKAAEKFAS